MRLLLLAAAPTTAPASAAPIGRRRGRGGRPVRQGQQPRLLLGRGARLSSAGGEGGVDGPRLHLLHPPLLQPKVRDELGEGRLGYEGEVRRGVAEVLVEPGGEHAEKGVVIDVHANIAELVSKSLEGPTIVVDGGVVLVAPEELLLQKNATLEAIVGEEPVQLGPHGVSIIAVLHDCLKQIR